MSQGGQGRATTRAIYLTVGDRPNVLLPGGASSYEVDRNSAGLPVLGRLPMQEAIRLIDQGREAFIKRAGSVYHHPKPLWEEAYFYALQKPSFGVQDAERFAYHVLELQNKALRKGSATGGTAVLSEYVWNGETYQPPYKESQMTRGPNTPGLNPIAGHYAAPSPQSQRVSPGGAMISGLRGPQRPAPKGGQASGLSTQKAVEVREYQSIDGEVYAIHYKEDGKVVPGYTNLVLLHVAAEISKGGNPSSIFEGIGLELTDANGKVVWDKSFLQRPEEEEESEDNMPGFNHG